MFIKLHRSYGRTKNVCPKCLGKIRESDLTHTFFCYFFVGFFGFIILLFYPNESLGWLFVNFAAFHLVCIIFILPHEFAHIAAAWLVGWRPFQIIIGSGNVIYQNDLFGIHLIIKLLPFGGLAYAAPPKERKYSRISHAFYVMAGPSFNLSMAFLALYWMGRSAETAGSETGLGNFFAPLFDRVAWVQLVFLSNVIVFVAGVWPRRVVTEAGKIPNDGLAFINILRSKASGIENLHALYYLLEASLFMRKQQLAEAEKSCERGLSGFPTNKLLLNLRGTILIRNRQYRDARECFVSSLSNMAETSSFRWVLLNNIAYSDALIGDASLMEEADQYSKEVIANLSWLSFAIGTRGTVLVEKGELEEGIELLKKAFQSNDASSDKALNACHLAIAEKKRGNLTDAARYLQIAKKLDPYCPLLKIASET